MISYENVAYCCAAGPPGVTFQVIVSLSGTLVFNYNTIQPKPTMGYSPPSIGYESHDGTMGDQISYGWDDYPSDSSSYIITPITGYVPRHTCGLLHTTTLGNDNGRGEDTLDRAQCQGSLTNLDDDEVSNIAPGSTILMLVYGVENKVHPPCMFPFTYEGTSYNQCTSVGSNSCGTCTGCGACVDGRRTQHGWCSEVAEWTNEMAGASWHNCDSLAGTGLGHSNCMTEDQHRAIFDAAISCISDESYRTAGQHCEYAWWAASISDVIPDIYAFSSTASNTSGDGAATFATRFGANWNEYIYHACVTGAGSTIEDQAACDHSNAAGNCIYDGGSDMYLLCATHSTKLS